MTAYYNEIDPFAAAWLRELIKAGHIAPGDVDERSIEDVTPNDLMGYAQCHFFAGIGVWSYALRNAGWDDDRPVFTGSCPCQPFSAAGKGDGFDDERHLWPAFHWLIAQCRPAVVFGEQVASKAVDVWIDLVQSDLEAMGYALGCVPLPAAGVGSPDIRDRNFWVAHTNNQGPQGQRRSVEVHAAQGRQDAPRHSAARPMASHYRDWKPEQGADGKLRLVGPEFGKTDHGSSGRVGRLRGYGNAINAQAAQAFIEAVMK